MITAITTPAKAKTSNRLWEIDTFRGIAIILMVIYHFTWDLNHFRLYPIENFLTGPWQIFARSIATMFIFIMGLSLTLSYNRDIQKEGQSLSFSKYLLRGLKIFAWGMAVTVATYLFVGPAFVIFGILHLLGIATIFAYPFLKINRYLSLLTGLLVIAIGIYIEPLLTTSPYFIGLGLRQINRPMVDFYPIFPWFGISLIGIFVGYSLYPHGKRLIGLPDLGDMFLFRALRFLGRHSLLIYLIHQPILIGIFIVLGYGSF